MRTTLRTLLGLTIMLSAASAFAHDPGLSSANLQLRPGEITALVTFNDRDISLVLGEPSQAVRDGGQAMQARLSTLAARALSLDAGGQNLPPLTVAARVDQNKNAEFSYTYKWPEGVKEVSVTSALLPEMPFGHRQVLTVLDSSGKEIARTLLSNHQNTARVTPGLLPPTVSRSFTEFLLLGIRHILTGYDHLLFLFGLLIVCRNLRAAAVLITCFTLAHSLTLALSTFGFVHLQSRWVESAIAASILYVGAENLWRGGGELRGRWLLTFTFGLVHGLGFASVLREMGLANTGLAAIVPLVSFNLGVEAGQLSVAAVLLPLILHFRRNPKFLRLGVPACSALVAVAGACWLVQRTLFS